MKKLGITNSTLIIYSLIAFQASNLVSQTIEKQMVVVGNIQFDGEKPSSDVFVYLLRKDSSSVKRIMQYDTASATFGVNIFRSEGFEENDPVLFKVVFTRKDSFIARSKNGIVRFSGTSLDPPLPPEIVKIFLFRNHLPSPVQLIAPKNLERVLITSVQDTIITFRWNSSADRDPEDTLIYILRIQSPNMDTTVKIIKDTVYRFIHKAPEQDSTQYSWSVDVFDGFESVHSTQIFTFKTIKNNLREVKMFDRIIPEQFSLSQNHPNPFNPSTTIRYSLPSSAKVRLTIHDMLGREIQTLIDEEQSAGWKVVNWKAANVASGIYFYKLQSGNFIETKKMIVIK